MKDWKYIFFILCSVWVMSYLLGRLHSNMDSIDVEHDLNNKECIEND
jgi:hypothetical protein